MLVEYDYLKCRKMLYEATRYTAIATLDPTPTGPPRGELGVQDVLGAGVRGRGELGQRWHLPAVRARATQGAFPPRGTNFSCVFSQALYFVPPVIFYNPIFSPCFIVVDFVYGYDDIVRGGSRTAE